VKNWVRLSERLRETREKYGYWGNVTDPITSSVFIEFTSAGHDHTTFISGERRERHTKRETDRETERQRDRERERERES